MICSIVVALHLFEELLLILVFVLLNFLSHSGISFFLFLCCAIRDFPNHVTNIPELVWILIFFSDTFSSSSTVLTNTDSIALGRLFMKMLKGLGDTPAELQAKYSFWRWNHWITTFSSTGYQFHRISLALSLHFLLQSHKVPVHPFLSLMSFFHNRGQEQKNALWGLSVQCFSLPACRSAGPHFSCFFALLLSWYKVHKAASLFSWGLAKCIFLLKNINSFLVLSHQWCTQSFPSSWMYKIICPAMPDSPCLVIQILWGRATWGGEQTKNLVQIY